MPDPFSIIAGSIGIIDVAVRFSRYIRDTAAAAINVNEDLKALLDEFDTLISVNRTIESICTPELMQSPSASAEDHDRLKELWTDTEKTLHGCRHVLEKLWDLVKEIIGEDWDDNSKGKDEQSLEEVARTRTVRTLGHSAIKKLDGFRVQLRKHKKDGEFHRLRLQLTTSQGALQTALSMINLWHSHVAQKSQSMTVDRLWEELQSLALELKAQLASLQRDPVPAPEFRNKHYQAPAATELFTGRELLLKHVKVAFALDSSTSQSAQSASLSSTATTGVASSPQRDTAIGIQKRFVIYGLGGSGKSEFCRKFAENNQRYFWGIFWIYASSDENAQHSFKSIANIGGVDRNMNAAKCWLSSLELPWLLVIDNADDPEVPVDRYLPGGERGHVLITTRDPGLKLHGSVGAGFCRLGKLEDKDAETLLLRVAEEPSPWKPSTIGLAASITKCLGHLPLALVHAGKAIAIGLTTLAEYVDYFNDHWRRVRWEASRFGHEVDDTSKNVFSSYDMIWRHLEDQPTQAAIDAIELLKLFSFLHCENIRLDFLITAAKNPWELEKKQLEALQQSEVQTFAQYTPAAAKAWNGRLKKWLVEKWLAYEDRVSPTHLPGVLRHVQAMESFNIHRLRKVLTELTRKSLITHRRPNAVDVYSMHPLVHKWVRERPQMRISEQGIWCQAANTMLTQCIHLPPLGAKETDQELRRHLLPHLDHLQKCQADFQAKLTEKRKRRWVSFFLVKTPGMDRKKALQYAKFSRVYAECGRFSEAADLQLQVKNFLVQMLGLEDPKTLVIIQALAGSYLVLTRFNDALKLQELGLQTCKRSLGLDHPKTLKLMDQLGKTQYFRGRFKEALKLHEDAIDGMTRTLGANHVDTLKAMDNLGAVHGRYFRYEKARDLHAKAFAGLEKTLGPTHEDTLSAMENLALAKLELGGDNLHSAREILTKVHDERCHKLGKENPYTLLSICNLGRVKSALGYTIEAEVEIRTALLIAIRNLGENHLGVLMGWTHLAQILVRQERYAEAEKIFLDVIDRSKYKAGAREEGEHPDQIMAMWYAAECYRLQGKYGEARQLCEDISKTLASIGGGLHPFAQRIRVKQEELRLAGEPYQASTATQGKDSQPKDPEPTIVRHQTIWHDDHE